MVNYLIYKNKQIKDVYCMNGCGVKLATLKQRPIAPGKVKDALVHFTHSKKLPVIISDGSYANLLVCSKCLKKGNFNLPELEATLYWGWEEAQKQKYSGKTNFTEKMNLVNQIKNRKKITKFRR